MEMFACSWCNWMFYKFLTSFWHRETRMSAVSEEKISYIQKLQLCNTLQQHLEKESCQHAIEIRQASWQAENHSIVYHDISFWSFSAALVKFKMVPSVWVNDIFSLRDSNQSLIPLQIHIVLFSLFGCRCRSRMVYFILFSSLEERALPGDKGVESLLRMLHGCQSEIPRGGHDAPQPRHRAGAISFVSTGLPNTTTSRSTTERIPSDQEDWMHVGRTECIHRDRQRVNYGMVIYQPSLDSHDT